jgi:glutathione S-transferase
LAEKFEGQGTPLLGKTLKEKGLVSQWVEVESQSYDRPVIALVAEVVWAPQMGKATKEEVVAEEMAKLLDVYEAHLAKSKYLAGDFFSLADLGHLPGTQALVNSGKKGAPFAARPHVNAWWEDISSRPSFKKIIAMSPYA